MSSDWVSFLVVIFVQVIFLLVHAYLEKRLTDLGEMLVKGFVLGFITGLIFDLLLGKYFGFYSYTLGFGADFMILNALLSYGLFATSVLALRTVSMTHFIVWLISLILVLEATNHYFTVWSWELGLTGSPLFVMLMIGYSAGAIFISASGCLLFKQKFLLKLSK